MVIDTFSTFPFRRGGRGNYSVVNGDTFQYLKKKMANWFFIFGFLLLCFVFYKRRNAVSTLKPNTHSFGTCWSPVCWPNFRSVTIATNCKCFSSLPPIKNVLCVFAIWVNASSRWRQTMQCRGSSQPICWTVWNSLLFKRTCSYSFYSIDQHELATKTERKQKRCARLSNEFSASPRRELTSIFIAIFLSLSVCVSCVFLHLAHWQLPAPLVVIFFL